jgi:hypothetical protein
MLERIPRSLHRPIMACYSCNHLRRFQPSLRGADGSVNGIVLLAYDSRLSGYNKTCYSLDNFTFADAKCDWRTIVAVTLCVQISTANPPTISAALKWTRTPMFVRKWRHLGDTGVSQSEREDKSKKKSTHTSLVPIA